MHRIGRDFDLNGQHWEGHASNADLSSWQTNKPYEERVYNTLGAKDYALEPGG